MLDEYKYFVFIENKSFPFRAKGFCVEVSPSLSEIHCDTSLLLWTIQPWKMMQQQL